MSNLPPGFLSIVDMGEVVKVHPLNRRAFLYDIAGCIFFILLAPASVYYVLSQFISSHLISLETIVIAIGSVLFIVLGVSSIKKSLSRRNDCAVVYQYGFAYFHNNEMKTFRWDEIILTRAKITNFRALGFIPAGKVRDFWIASNSKNASLAGTLDQVDDLMTEILRRARNAMSAN